jgi:hypothetical protein
MFMRSPLDFTAVMSRDDCGPGGSDNIARLYHNMAVFYWRANDRTKAIEAAQKAVDMLKSGKRFSESKLVALRRNLMNIRGSR